MSQPWVARQAFSFSVMTLTPWESTGVCVGVGLGLGVGLRLGVGLGLGVGLALGAGRVAASPD